MKRILITTIMMLLLPGAYSAVAQDYQAPQVKISQDKVRVNGKSYYAHVVTEKQTLYSISKAYNVSLQDIYDANKNLDLENAGLKTGQVIFIPTQPSAPAQAPAAKPYVKVDYKGKACLVIGPGPLALSWPLQDSQDRRAGNQNRTRSRRCSRRYGARFRSGHPRQDQSSGSAALHQQPSFRQHG